MGMAKEGMMIHKPEGQCDGLSVTRFPWVPCVLDGLILLLLLSGGRDWCLHLGSKDPRVGPTPIKKSTKLLQATLAVLSFFNA